MKRFTTMTLVALFVGTVFATAAPATADTAGTNKKLCDDYNKMTKKGQARARGYHVVMVHCPDQEKVADAIACDGSSGAFTKSKSNYEDCLAYINRSETTPPPAPSPAPSPTTAPQPAPKPTNGGGGSGGGGGSAGGGGGGSSGPKPVCDPSSQPAPHWGVKGGRCLPSCGGAGGTASFGDACSNHNMQEVGPAYDVPHCCK